MKVGDYCCVIGLSVVGWVCVLVDWSFGVDGMSGFVDYSVETIVVVSGVSYFSSGTIRFD